MTKIVFFEVEPWEKNYINERLRNHELIFIDDKLQEKNVSLVKDAEVIAIFIYSRISKETLSNLPNLKLITTMSTGFDHIDVEECKKKNVVVCNVPSYGKNTVAEYAMTLLLALAKRLVPTIEKTRRGNFDLEGLRGFDLNGKTIGVVGTGKIGRHMVHYAKAFGMKVIAFEKFPDATLAKKYDLTYVDFDTLLAESHVISLHLPETEETHHIINKKNVGKIKKGCILINTARGGLVESEAILMGLKENNFSAVGLDVLEEENVIKEEKALLHETFQKTCDLKTLLVEHMLLEQPNVLITPHNAFNTHEAVKRILDTTIGNINAFYSGVRDNVLT